MVPDGSATKCKTCQTGFLKVVIIFIMIILVYKKYFYLKFKAGATATDPDSCVKCTIPGCTVCTDVNTCTTCVPGKLNFS
jgi:hypothetical protein